MLKSVTSYKALIFVILDYREYKNVTFDKILIYIYGFSPNFVQNLPVRYYVHM